jgi:hypothetical protein
MLKLPLPPRSAQNRSSFSCSDTRKTSPPAVTASAEITVSQVQQQRRVR